MLNNILKLLIDRVLKEFPSFGSIHIRLFFHANKFVKYEFETTEIIVLNGEQNNVKKEK
jgi:hypothetical protein